jgi:IS1 family transposase
MVSMNQLTNEKRVQVIASLVEGNSVRSTVRMTSVAKNTVAKLLCQMGEACLEFQDKALRNLTCKKIQCDEIWAFCYSKQKNVPEHLKGAPGVGDVWTWVAMDADTKLVPSWLVGARDAATAWRFVADLNERVTKRPQLTTDGNRLYLEAVDNYFGPNVDYSMLVKMYGEDKTDKTKYSPGKCLGTRKQKIMGNPDPAHVSTSYVERQNLTMRMGMRRFTRLTNGYSKKVENMAYAVAIHFMHYNFVRLHSSLRSTPAMKAGVADHKWSIEEMVGLLPELKYNTRPKKPA